MKLLLDTERDASITDVLLATVFEILASGEGRTTSDLLIQIEADWPGVVVGQEKLERTLQVAEERNYLTSTALTLQGVVTWSLGERADVSVDESKRWAQEILDRCAAQVMEQARQQDLPASSEQASYWTELLLEVLHEGIVQAFSKDPSKIRTVKDRIFPPYNTDQVRVAIRDRVDDEDTARFLTALALASLDPGSTFGSEVVHYLATGYILYALMLGYDVIDQREEVGSFEGVTLFLDTPVLLRLLSPGEEFRWTSDLVGRVASAAGAQVVVTERTKDELHDLMDRRDEDASAYEAEFEGGTSREALVLTATDEILAIWLSDPSKRGWSEFKDAQDDLFRTLAAIGVQTDFLPDGYRPSHERSAQFTTAVQECTRARGKPRHAVPADHDGQVMAIAEFVRGAWRSGEGDPLWPGAFVVTSDRSLSDAYRSVTSHNGDAPLALTVSQAAALLARTAQPGDVERLAELIASDHQWQARFSRAASFGVDQAIEVARSFASDDADRFLVDTTVVQLTFEEILEEAGFDGNSTTAAREAIARQERRRNNAREHHQDQQTEEGVRERERTAAQAEQVRVLKQSIIDRDAALESERGAKDGLATELEARDKKVVEKDRAIVVVIAYAVVLITVLALAAFDVIPLGSVAFVAVAMVATAKWLSDWVRDPTSSVWTLVIAVSSWAALAVIGGVLFNG